MSSDTPGPTGGPVPEPNPDRPEVEYLGDRPPTEPHDGSAPRRRRTAVVVGATAAVVGAGAAGAWAVAQFMSGGPAPATAVPDEAILYVALDIDPDGGQKIEAVQTLRKFPAIREELGIDAEDDLRRVLYDAITAELPCPDIDFEDDVDPWLGGKLAVAALPGEEEPVMFFSVQVKDEAEATAGIETIAECADEDVPGTAFLGDYMVVAETQEIADDIVADAEEGSLADDDAFGRWIDEAGGSGILEAYASAEAPQYFAEEIEDIEEPIGGGELDGLTDGEVPTPDVEEAFAGFEGAAVVARFDDEALEVEMAAGGAPTEVETGGDSGLEDLPATTALALGFGVSDSAVEQMLDSLSELSGTEREELDGMLAQAEEQTGLELPEDLQTLLGDGVSFAVDSSMDVDAMMNGAEPDVAELPVGVRIVGDPDAISEVVDKVRAALGPLASQLVVEEGDGVVALGIDADYVATLAEDGSLGDEERFEAALDGADVSAGGFYVDFDAGDWLTELAAMDEDPMLAENVEPLDSLGVSGSLDDETSHVLVRLTTD